MFIHNIYKGNKPFNKNNKTIIVVVRKQPGEIDWILPVLDHINNKFNIIVIFEKKIAHVLLKENKILYNFFLNTVCCYFTHSFFKNFFLRFSHKILMKIGIFSLSYLNNRIYKNFYNLFELENSCNINNISLKLDDVRVLMQDFTDNSPWIKKFFENNSKTKIVSYPHTTNIFGNLNNTKIKNKKKFEEKNFILINSKLDLKYLENKINNKNYFLCGYPKYDISWLKKIEKKFNFKKKSSFQERIFIAFKGFDPKFYDKSKYEHQLKSLFEYANYKKNCKLIFKFHPKAQEDKVFLNIANIYPKKIWEITKDHLHIGSKKSDIFVSFFRNASILDGLASNKIPVELWNINNRDRNNLLKIKSYEKSHYSKLNLCISPSNNTEMIFIFDQLLNRRKIYKKNPIISFVQLCKTKKSIVRTSNFIKKISS